jgi:hypothetical protein
VSEFDDDDIVGFHEIDDLVKAAFARVRAGTAAADCLVDDGEGDGVWEVDAPAWIVLGWVLEMKKLGLRTSDGTARSGHG